MSGLRTGQIRARGLGRHFELQRSHRTLRGLLLRRESAVPVREFWAVRGVDLDIEPGQTFGLVGRNGSGKSTLLKMLARIYAPSEGACEMEGRVGSLLELGAGFHHEFTGVENIYLAASILGIPRREIAKRVDKILDFAELDDFADQPVKTYSSGMYVRLGFAMAMEVRPDILLLDEVLAVGDEAFQQKCMGRIMDFRRGGGTMVFVSHDPGAVERLCDRAILLEHGKPVFTGTGIEVVQEYHRHLIDERNERTNPVLDESHRPGEGIEVTVTSCGEDGKLRDAFVEGQTMYIDFTITSDVDIPEAEVVTGLRESSGFVITGQHVRGVTISAGVPRVVRWTFPQSQFRSGVFLVAAHVLTSDHEALAMLEGLHSITAYSSRPDFGGPMALDSELMPLSPAGGGLESDVAAVDSYE